MNTRKDRVTKKDLQAFKDEIIQQFHIISEGLIDQIKLLAEGHSGIIRKLDQMEKENERQHLKEVQEWKKQVQVRFQVWGKPQTSAARKAEIKVAFRKEI